MTRVHPGAAIAGVVVAALMGGCSGMHSREIVQGAQMAKVATVAVLPFENVTTTADAGKAASQVVAEQLSATRLELVDADETLAALEKLDPPPSAAADRLIAIKVGQALKADAVVFGTVTEAASPGREPVNQAALGLSLRMVQVEDGDLVFSGTYSVSAGGHVTDSESVKPLALPAAHAMAEKVGR